MPVDAIKPGALVDIAPSIRRLTAFNAGTMTGPGTNTWILGEKEIAVLDPGPASPRHIGNIVDQAPGEVRWVLVTHTHLDHSPGAALLAELTGASLMTVVIAPPDGDMSAYMASLDRLLGLPIRAMAPGHGRWIEQPNQEIRGLIAHREKREGRVVSAMRALGPAALEAILARVYDDVPQRLHPVAAFSLEAHLLKLEREGRAARDGASWRLADGAAQ